MIHTRQFREARILPREEVTEGDLLAISELAMRQMTADEVYVRRLLVANDQTDRDYERFPQEYLDRFAATLPGKPLLLGHEHRNPGIGRIHAAAMETIGKENWVSARSYVLRHPQNDFAISQIDAGVWHAVSIGAYCDVLLCDVCGRDYYALERGPDGTRLYCPHIRGERYDGRLCTLTWGGDIERVEALETSLVWLGAQIGARVALASAADASRDDVKRSRLESLARQESEEQKREKQSVPALSVSDDDKALILEARERRGVLRTRLSGLVASSTQPVADYTSLLEGEASVFDLTEAITRLESEARARAKSLPTVDSNREQLPRREPWASYLW